MCCGQKEGLLKVVERKHRLLDDLALIRKRAAFREEFLPKNVNWLL
jgi:hypothetical protein